MIASLYKYPATRSRTQQVIQLAPLAHGQGLRPVIPATRPELPHLDLTERTAFDEREPTIALPFGTALGRRRLVHDRCRGRQVCFLAQYPGLTTHDRLRSGLRLRRDQRLLRGGGCKLGNSALPRPSRLAPGGHGITRGRNLLRPVDGGRRRCIGRLILTRVP